MGAVQQLVYIVDDSADYRLLVGQVFKRFLTQYTVHFFESGLSLVEQLQARQTDTEIPCLMLIDGHMPGLSGVETLTRLKQQPDWQKVPMVIFSSSTAETDRRNAYASGANLYVVKPTDLLSLKEQLDAICQRWTAAACTTDTL